MGPLGGDQRMGAGGLHGARERRDVVGAVVAAPVDEEGRGAGDAAAVGPRVTVKCVAVEDDAHRDILSHPCRTTWTSRGKKTTPGIPMVLCPRNSETTTRHRGHSRAAGPAARRGRLAQMTRFDVELDQQHLQRLGSTSPLTGIVELVNGVPPVCAEYRSSTRSRRSHRRSGAGRPKPPAGLCQCDDDYLPESHLRSSDTATPSREKQLPSHA